MSFHTPDTFEILHGQAPGAGGESQLADAINKQAIADQVEAVTLISQRFDCGSVKGFLHAIMHVAQQDGVVWPKPVASQPLFRRLPL